ncbi:MAG TPA: DUF6518 family protein [Gaiellaceae bacterium]|nr:DUF6518 family protein [Gaiellaceae bacterium]
MGASPRLAVPVALVLAAVFGAGDQYLGSLTGSAHTWAAGWSTDLSLLSAPWLVLPFLAGATQSEARRAALLGLACTYAALLGYAVLTLSPVENAHLTLAGLRGFAVSERSVLVGGIVTGPLFGWFGGQWRTRRAISGALVTALALCLEPLARRVSIDPIQDRAVWLAEIVAGLAFAAAVLLGRRADGFQD